MKRLVVVVSSLVLGTSPAFADLELGGTLGVHVFSEDNALGVEDAPDAESMSNSALFGLRLGYMFTTSLGAEAELGVVPGEPRMSKIISVYNLVYRANVIFQIGGGPTKKLVPFVLAGGGAMQVVQTDDPDIIDKDLSLVPHAGGGLKLRTGSGWGVRADLRLMLPPSSEGGGVTQDFEALLTVYRDFGKKPEKKAPPPPPKEEDPDKDGIFGAADGCPDKPEDMDEFEDDDGCPDDDNDKDGIADADDKCRGEAEDKDDFEDADGCPELDNDKDGIADAQDKCPNEIETVNGFEDADGCPDTIPEKLAQFTGVIQGINFKTNSADILVSSTKTLEAAVAVLVEFKDTKLEIQGHTDDAKITKASKFADNTALSQARAESVKAYFVGKGVDESRLTAKGYGESQPVEDPAGLKGAKLKNARARNRRVEFKLITDEPAATPPSEEPTPEPAPEEPKPE